jgi:mono/diheme cytochrome c family protein
MQTFFGRFEYGTKRAQRGGVPRGGGAKRLLSAVAMTVAAMLCAAPLRAQGAGKEIFLAKCAKCHGENGVPRRIAKGAPNFTDPQWAIPLEQIERSVREGKGNDMLPFKSKLDPGQIKVVAEFVQALNAQARAQTRND